MLLTVVLLYPTVLTHPFIFNSIDACAHAFRTVLAPLQWQGPRLGTSGKRARSLVADGRQAGLPHARCAHRAISDACSRSCAVNGALSVNGACCDERAFRERRVLRRARFPMSASHAPIADLVLLPCPYGNDPSTPTAYSRLSIQEPMARPDSARGLAVPERLPSAPHGLVVLPHGLVVLVGIPGWREVLWARKRHLFHDGKKIRLNPF